MHIIINPMQHIPMKKKSFLVTLYTTLIHNASPKQTVTKTELKKKTSPHAKTNSNQADPTTRLPRQYTKKFAPIKIIL